MSSIIVAGYHRGRLKVVITVEIYKQIRRMRLQGMSQRQIATSLHISRNTVKKYWDGDSVPWERKGMPRALIEAMSKGCPCIASNAGVCQNCFQKSLFTKKETQDSLFQ